MTYEYSNRSGHRPKAAGGYATGSVENMKSVKVKTMPIICQSTDDPDHKAVLSAIGPFKPARPHLAPDRFAQWGFLPAGVRAGQACGPHYSVMDRYFTAPWLKANSSQTQERSKP